MKVALNLFPWYTPMLGCGVSFKIDAVQIIDLVEYSGKPTTPEGFGFEAEDGNAVSEEQVEEVAPSGNDFDF